MDLGSDLERCVKLHNALLAKTYESVPNASQHFQRNMIARVRKEIPDAAARLLEVPQEDAERITAEDLPFYRFFSKIETYSPENRSPVELPLSAEFKQPDPAWFYPSLLEGSSDERHIILLYPNNVLQEPRGGGLFLDLGTWTVTWACLKNPKDIPKDSEAWIPPELALIKGLQMWGRDKYYWDGDPTHRSSRLLLRSWAQKDLDDAIEAWHGLLQATQEYLPADSAAPQTCQDPLPAKLVDEFQISPFAKAFLKAARRPSFTYVTPRLTTFTDTSFGELMRSEIADAPRRAEIDRIGLEPDEWPSLVLPAAPSIGPLPWDPPPPGDQFFDKPGGYGLYTIARTAGLYTGISREDGDITLLITAEGKANEQTIKFAFPQPRGNDRGLTFAEMFELWAYFVRHGGWKVDVDGIVTPHSWFARETRTIDWTREWR